VEERKETHDADAASLVSSDPHVDFSGPDQRAASRGASPGTEAVSVRVLDGTVRGAERGWSV
jgi:hypothetical protein